MKNLKIVVTSQNQNLLKILDGVPTDFFVNNFS